MTRPTKRTESASSRSAHDEGRIYKSCLMAAVAAPPSIADVPCRAADGKFISCRGGSEEGTGGAGCDPQPFAYGGARKGRSAMIIYGSVVSPFVRKRSEENTSELQSLMRISYAVFCLKKTQRQTIHKYYKIDT